MKCIECGRYVADGEAYFDNAAARALIPFAGRLMSDGPFCSKGCKRNHLEAKEAKSLKKEAKSLGMSASASYDTSDLKEQRRILELQKEEREAIEQRERQLKEAEELRQRQAKASVLREQGHRTRAFMLHHQHTVWGGVVLYVFVVFFASITLPEHKGEMAAWVWVVGGLLLAVAGGLVVRGIVRDARVVKANLA